MVGFLQLLRLRVVTKQSRTARGRYLLLSYTLGYHGTVAAVTQDEPAMRFRFSAVLALPLILIAVGTAPAVFDKLTQLSEVLEGDDYIFVASVDKLGPRETAGRLHLTLEKKIKGEVKFERIPVNMTGTDESKKANDTKIIFDRLDPTRKVVFFISKRGDKKYNAKVFVEGS